VATNFRINTASNDWNVPGDWGAGNVAAAGDGEAVSIAGS
jgi:hypothetical protein